MSDMSATCTACGAALLSAARFCGVCGASVAPEASADTPPGTPAHDEEPPGAVAIATVRPIVAVPPGSIRHSRFPLLLGVGAAVVGTAVAIGAWMWIGAWPGASADPEASQAASETATPVVTASPSPSATPTAVATLPGAPRPTGTVPGGGPVLPSVGARVTVVGTGTCLRLRREPSLSATSGACVPDGTILRVTAGPRATDGHVWWAVDRGGWATGDYLATDAVVTVLTAILRRDAAALRERLIAQAVPCGIGSPAIPCGAFPAATTVHAYVGPGTPACAAGGRFADREPAITGFFGLIPRETVESVIRERATGVEVTLRRLSSGAVLARIIMDLNGGITMLAGPSC